jgi:alkanesulfonate monooxygenase SsuD/methylene tetrahydromethanopterin reductase-like flavin-dependent oxidoreductase (luciferase family)
MKEIKFNLYLPSWNFKKTREHALLAEEMGFYSVSFGDHFYMAVTQGGSVGQKATTPNLECYTSLAAVAAITKRVKLLTAVTPIGFRNPAVLGKMTATLDHISEGRLIVGLGSGWQRAEYEAYNLPFAPNAERLRQLEDAIKLLKVMWTDPEPTYHGTDFKIDKAYNYPQPTQKPHPPIMIGGGGRKVIQLAGRYADFLSLVPPNPDGTSDLHRSVTFTKKQRAAGREASRLEVSTLSYMLMSRDKSQAEQMLAASAADARTDIETARAALTYVSGTPAEVRREIRSRYEELDLSYFSFYFSSREMLNTFASEVMPEFA